jgi:hypothetical protein
LGGLSAKGLWHNHRKDVVVDKSQSSEMVILTVVCKDRDIAIRIDQDSLAFNQLQESQVVSLTLRACNNAESVFKDLCEFVDRPVEYTIIEEGDATHVSFWLDWGVLELEVKCAQVTISKVIYTADDLKHKIDRLSALYRNNMWQSESNERAYYLMRDTLQRMIKKEIESSQRRIDFFQKTNPDKASFLAGAIAAYQKVLAKIDEIEKEALDIRLPD